MYALSGLWATVEPAVLGVGVLVGAVFGLRGLLGALGTWSAGEASPLGRARGEWWLSFSIGVAGTAVALASLHSLLTPVQPRPAPSFAYVVTSPPAFEPPPRPFPTRPPPAPPVDPEAVFKKELESLKGVQWTKQDAVQPHLTWYAIEDGLLLADSRSNRISRFAGLFGYEKLKVATVAFSDKYVWAATERGLMAWDRRVQFWARFAPGGRFDLIEVPIEELSVKDGKLCVTAAPAGRPPRRFECDLKDSHWVELK